MTPSLSRPAAFLRAFEPFLSCVLFVRHHSFPRRQEEEEASRSISLLFSVIPPSFLPSFFNSQTSSGELVVLWEKEESEVIRQRTDMWSPPWSNVRKTAGLAARPPALIPAATEQRSAKLRDVALFKFQLFATERNFGKYLEKHL